MFRLVSICSLWLLASDVEGKGLLILYRPTDISVDCATSEYLRYDLTFGMGMSDTITLVFRTLSELDYECVVEIGSQTGSNVHLLIVIKFPNTIGTNCVYNRQAFTIMQPNNTCFALCDYATNRDRVSQIFPLSTTKLFQFRFMSNSSINSDMNALQYEVTVTSARKLNLGNRPCDTVNETLCMMGPDSFCFTSGVVCDGIKNCGVTDWFDERGSDCKVPAQGMGITPVIAVAAALLCATLAGIHLLFKCLPPLANSFFIFNSNEDNRFSIVPIFKAPDNRRTEIEQTRRTSIIPVDYSSSDSKIDEEQDAEPSKLVLQDNVISFSNKYEPHVQRKTRMKYFKDKILRTMRTK